MVTLSRVCRLALDGAPETQDSWFPGYAWTIANCPTCGCGVLGTCKQVQAVRRGHLGWRFSAAQPDLSPREFWGLRRDRLANSPFFFEEQQTMQQ